MWLRVDGLRSVGLGTPGAMRDHLNALVLSGAKTATAGLLTYDYEAEGESLDVVGERQVLLDSEQAPLALVEITRVEQHRFGDVPWEFADAEGEGFRNIEHWRDGHREFYAACGLEVTDDDSVICVWFRLVHAL